MALVLVMGLPVSSADAAPPTLVAEAATEVGYSTARAHGVISPGGEEAFYRFEYIADPLYDHNVLGGGDPFTGATADGFGRLPAGPGGIAVAPLLGEAGGLEAGVEYHLRLVAENTEGAVIAVAPSFTTPRPLEPIACVGDNCQVLPPEPRDPVLSTTVAGVGNPKVHYTNYGHKPKKGKKHAKKGKGKKHAKKGKGKGKKAKKRSGHTSRASS
jgi:hypothetical protein